MATLKFTETMSVDAFKRFMNCSKVQVINNPKKDGSKFLTIDSDESFRGAVSGEIDEIMANPAISKVEGDSGEFWMLHKKQSANVIAEL